MGQPFCLFKFVKGRQHTVKIVRGRKMGAKIFILAFAAVVSQARSQSYVPAISATGDCSASETVVSASSYSPQTLLSGDTQALNFGNSGFRGNVFPSPPTTCTKPLNLYSESEPSDFLRQPSSTSRNGAGLKWPVLAEASSRQCGNCGSQMSQVSSIPEEISRSNLCATESYIPTPTSLLRPNLSNFRPCACEGSLENSQSTPERSASSAFSESNLESNSYLGPINSVTPLLPNFNWNRVSPNVYGNQNNIATVTEPCRPISNGINNVQTTSTAETSTTANNAGRPFGNQATSITTTSNAESSTTVNARPNGCSPNYFRGLNNNQQESVSSISTSEATTTVSTPRTYSSNVFGGNLGQTSVTTAESSSSATTASNAGPSRFSSFSSPGFNNIASSATANSEANTFSSNGYPSTINSAQSNAAAESSAIATSNAVPTRFPSCPSPGFNNIATSAVANSEANSLSSNGYRSSINSAQSYAAAESSASAVTSPNTGPSRFSSFSNPGFNNIASSATANSEANSLSSNGYRGSINSAQSSAAAESSASAGSVSNVGLSRFPIIQNSQQCGNFFNNAATSSLANSEASALSSTGMSRSINSAQSSAAAESSANSAPSRFPFISNPGFNNVATSAAASSGANTINFNGYGGSVNSAQSSANAEAASSYDIRPFGNMASNHFGGLNNVGQTCLATGAAAEAGAVSNIGHPNPFSTRFPGPISPFKQASTNVEADSSCNVGIPNTFPSNISPLSTSTCSERNSVYNYPTRTCSPNGFSGFNTFDQPSATSIANSEASSTAQIGSNGYGTSTSEFSATSETVSSTRPINSFSPRAYQPSLINSFSTSEATSSANTGSGFATNIRPCNSLLPCNCQPQCGNSLSISEVSSSANAASGFTPNIYGPTSLYPSSATSAASSEAMSTTGATNFLPYQSPYATSLAASEASSSSNIGPGLSPSFATSSASSEAISSIRPPNVYSPCGFGGFNNLGTTVAASNADASSSINIGPNNAVGFNNIVAPSTVSSFADSEASSIVSGPPTIPTPLRPWISNCWNNLASPVPATATASSEYLSTANIIPTNAVPPNFYGGISQTACLSAPPITPPHLEPPLFNPTSCSPLGVSNKFYSQPFGYETFVPSYLSGFEFSQPSIVSSLNPLATSLNELSEFITSIVPIIEIVDSSNYNPFGYTSAAVPILGGFGSVNSLSKVSGVSETSSGSLGSETGSAAVAVASTDNAAAVSSSVATSEVTTVEPAATSIPQTVQTTTTVSSSTASASDIASPVTPYENEEISSSSASSSTTVVTEQVVPVEPVAEVIEPVVSSVATSSAVSEAIPCSESAVTSSATSTATSTSVTSSTSSVTSASLPTVASTATSSSVSSSSSTIPSPSSPISYRNPSTIELPPVTLEVQIPRSFTSSFSTNLCGCQRLPCVSSSCYPMSTSPVVYELQIPKSIPAQLSCSLASVPATKPVLCMNVEPIGICGC